ncbi:MAG: DUF6505 family protein [Hyphomicrobiales bacterium]
MKFLRVIRFDRSDEHAFERAASPGEWAVTGGFEFADIAPADLIGKRRQAFANGFLGLPSFGRSTFATIGEMGEAEFGRVTTDLAQHFVDAYGAPDLEAALPVAREEMEFVLDLCAGKPVNAVFTVRRVLEDGQIREEFREIAPPSEPGHARIWEVVEDDA